MSELYIKMTDEEYKEYQKYKSNKKRISMNNLGLIEFFELKGFNHIFDNCHYDYDRHRYVQVYYFENKNQCVNIETFDK